MSTITQLKTRALSHMFRRRHTQERTEPHVKTKRTPRLQTASESRRQRRQGNRNSDDEIEKRRHRKNSRNEVPQVRGLRRNIYREHSRLCWRISTSSGTRLNNCKRSFIHLDANPDQQRKQTEWIEKNCDPSRRKSRPATEQDWMNSKEVSSISAQTPTSSGTRLNEFKRSFIHLGANPSTPKGNTEFHLHNVSSLFNEERAR